MAKGELSAFRLNVDGIPTTFAENITIEPNDSLWVFVEVTVDPNDENTPFIEQDSVVFLTNGNMQDVDLVAFGQNAHFFTQDTLQTQTWTDDKPYVIYQYIVIDSLQTLTIEQGCNIHLHNGASIIAKGNLNVNGTADSLVTFGGTRLEDNFNFLPAQWGAIFLYRNTENEINFADIKSGVYGLAIGVEFNENGFTFENTNLLNKTKCVINNSKIRYNFAANLFTILSDLEVNNSLIYNGTKNVQGLLGGSHNFKNCTFASVNNRFFFPEDPTISFSTILPTDEAILLADLEEATFENCIVFGNLKEELEFLNVDSLTTTVNYTFKNCIVKTDSIDDPNLIDCLINVNPEFAETSEENYQLSEESPAINVGNVSTALTTDLLGVMRDENPDIGCYEFVE